MTKGRSRRAAERKVYHATFGSLAWVRNCGGRLFAKRSCWRVVHRHVVKLPHTDAPTRTRAREQYGSVHGRARTMFVCDVPPLGRRPEHRIDRLTPIRPQMGRLLEPLRTVTKLSGERRRVALLRRRHVLHQGSRPWRPGAKVI